MLRNKIISVLEQDTISKSKEKQVDNFFSEYVVKAIEQDDTQIIANFLGKDGYKNYSTPQELSESAKKQEQSKNNEDTIDLLLKVNTTRFLNLALNYACKKGKLKIVKYLIEELHLPGDLDVDMGQHRGVIDSDLNLKGTPLKLAAESGNLALVKFLYENTDALIETCLEEPREPTALMLAAKEGKASIVDYFLESKKANPNSHRFNTFNTATPLRYGIDSKKYDVVKSLVDGGAFVTSEDVAHALSEGCPINLVEILLKNSLTDESDKNSYLLSTIEGGNISSLEYFEKQGLYQLKPNESDDRAFLKAAAKSGSVEMMQYLVEKRHIPLEKYINEEYKPDPERDFGNDSKLNKILKCVIQSRKDHCDLLKWLVKGNYLKTSEEVVKDLCEQEYGNLQATAYLFSLLPEFKNDEEILKSIANDLPNLPLASLFKIYNTEFIQKGNKFFSSFSSHFVMQIEKLINSKIDKKTIGQELRQMYKYNREAAIGAWFYFCSVKFIPLLTEENIYHLLYLGIPINSQNCLGETALKAATSFQTIDCLLRHHADPDVPDKKGQTVIDSFAGDDETTALLLRYSQGHFCNSLRYASKTDFGADRLLNGILKSTKGEISDLPLEELVANCFKNERAYFILPELLRDLSQSNFLQMLELLNNPEFLKKNEISEKDIEQLFSRFESDQKPEISYRKGMVEAFRRHKPKKSNEPKNKDGLTPSDLADVELATKIATFLEMNPASVDVTNGLLKISFIGFGSFGVPPGEEIGKVQKELVDSKIISPIIPKPEKNRKGLFEFKPPHLYEILPEYSTKEAIAVVDKLLAEKHLKVANPWWEMKA